MSVRARFKERVEGCVWPFCGRISGETGKSEFLRLRVLCGLWNGLERVNFIIMLNVSGNVLGWLSFLGVCSIFTYLALLWRGANIFWCFVVTLVWIGENNVRIRVL